jgi:hypothetical protein
MEAPGDADESDRSGKDGCMSTPPSPAGGRPPAALESVEAQLLALLEQLNLEPLQKDSCVTAGSIRSAGQKAEQPVRSAGTTG